MNYLIKNAEAIAGQPTACDIRIQNGIISEIGNELKSQSDEQLIDASSCVIYPGFVNTHHHLAQSALKGIPAGLNQGLGEWLASVPYTYWPHFTPELMYDAALIGLSEQLRSGVTTCADHHYLYHANTTPELEDALWQAADDLGVRLVLCRGGATVQGTHKGMLKNNIVPESIDLAIQRIDNSRQKYHQQHCNAMRRVVVSPTTIVHSCQPDDLKTYAEYARSHQLKLHSHLLEVDFDETQAQQKYGMSAVEYAHSVNWLGEDVWFAHIVQATEKDIKILGETKTGIAHCPTSNCRLGSGIAPVLAMEKAGMTVSIGVDGSASSESGSMLQEVNLSWLIHRSQFGATATNLEQCLKWSTKNGAKILGIESIGEIKIGQAADLVLYNLDHYRYHGMHERLYAPILGGEPALIKTSLVNGRILVENGQITQLDETALKYRFIQNLAKLKQKITA
ncbi:amidohydrolase family protein [Catenovulum sp. 2E275]|uniref:amidohydrolase family protein n=1 Tax=Catenovulum sp. 2E275 TaxID=2980497 RepID=UPI0021D184F2|nr:amidohydrolase family protein [Catenovulum sp. 2E275]MCU4676065.1 amidohydrolase family protein [Catenovulum sp. 2E275]